MLKIIRFFFSMVALAIILTTGIYSSAQSIPPSAHYQFLATSAESCGAGTLRFFGYSYGYQQQGHFAVSNTLPYYGDPGGYLIYQWTMADEAGTLAQGSYNSQTGASTNGTYGSSIDFDIPRYPVGNLTFRATGTVYGRGGSGSLCYQSFDASTYTAISGGGFFNLNLSTAVNYRFQNSQNNLFLQVADANDYTPATLGNPGDANQVWALTSAVGSGRYKISNTLSSKPLYSDFQSGNTSVLQLSGATHGWQFISTGDGVTLYIVYEYNNRLFDPQYAMQPASESAAPVPVEAVQRDNSQKQKWYVTVQQ
jgi:hypothetical protein